MISFLIMIYMTTFEYFYLYFSYYSYSRLLLIQANNLINQFTSVFKIDMIRLHNNLLSFIYFAEIDQTYIH